MAYQEKTDMLLFCKERLQYPRVLALYFVRVDTLSTPQFRIHRYVVRSGRTFESFALGGIYDLQVGGRRLHDYEEKGQMQLSNQLYTRLLEQREIRFGDIRKHQRLKRRGKPVFSAEDAYAFSEAKELAAYRAPIWKRILVFLMRTLSFAIALLIPFAAYIYLLYDTLGGFNAPISTPTVVQVMLYAILAMPMMVFLMTLLNVSLDLLFLNIEFSRWIMLKRYVLMYAMARKSTSLARNEAFRLLRFGGIALVLLLLAFFMQPLVLEWMGI